MGAVYEAVERDTGREVALKVISFKKGASPDTHRRQLERFSREARTMAAADHPRLVRFLEQGDVDGRPYFTMELIKGTTLRDRLRFQGTLSVPELRRIAVELCEALDHMHGRGVVHRDVKPDNVMLMPDGTARLMDFGIAIQLGEQDAAAPGGFEGSPAYMSPEQVLGRAVDGRTDIYSLAVTLYEAATGHRAFAGENIAAITHQVVNSYPAPPAGLPSSLQGVLMRAMAKDPSTRYPVAREMAEDIVLGRIPNLTFNPVQGVQPEFILPRTPAAAPPQRSQCHPARPAAGRCTACGSAICIACLVELHTGGIYCRTCVLPPPPPPG